MVLSRVRNYGIDGFLMYWFALDILAMPRPGRLAALHDQMAKIYDLDTATVKARFRLGRLLGLRDDIVHDGLHPPIHIRALDYVASVYWDLMLHTLALSPQLPPTGFLRIGPSSTGSPKPIESDHVKPVLQAPVAEAKRLGGRGPSLSMSRGAQALLGFSRWPQSMNAFLISSAD